MQPSLILPVGDKQIMEYQMVAIITVVEVTVTMATDAMVNPSFVLNTSLSHSSRCYEIWHSCCLRRTQGLLQSNIILSTNDR